MHRAVNRQRGPRVIEGAFHIQNVDAYDSRLKTWIRRSNGAAAKRPDNHPGWRRPLGRYRNGPTPVLCLKEAATHRPLQQLIQTESFLGSKNPAGGTSAKNRAHPGGSYLG